MKTLLHRIWFCLTLMAGATGFLRGSAIAQPGTADLMVTFTNSPQAVTLGQYFTCSTYFYNPGWGWATNIVVTNQLPPGLEFVSVTSTRGVCTQSAGVVTWNLGNLLPTYFATMTMEFRATGLGSYTNVAGVTSDTPDPNPTNSQSSFVTLVTPARFFGVGRTHTGYFLPTVTALSNNHALVVGAPLNRTADVYNVSTRLFELTSNTMSLHSHHTATLMTNGLVLVVGGNYLPYTPEVYDPSTSQFRAVGNTYAPRWYHTATLLSDGRVLLCGNAYPPLTNEVFNPVTETFSLADPSLQCAPAGTLLPNGKYLTVNWGIASLYDPVTGLSTNTGPPIEKRSYHTMTLLPGGKVLIGGGQIFDSQYASTDSAEVYDIASGKFSPTAYMTTRRREHGACALPDGTALVCGGYITYNDVSNLDRAEVYDPDGTRNVPGVGVSDASVVEGDSGTNFLDFNVWLTAPSTLPVSVDFATAGVTANSYGGVAGYDFVPTNGTLAIPPGATNQVLRIAIVCDTVREGNEALRVSLKFPTQAWMARSVALGTIVDDDPVPSVSVIPVTPIVTERDTGLSNLVFNVTLSAQCLDQVTVDCATRDDSATAGQDYVSFAGALAFQPGETNKVVLVPAIGETLEEPDETLTIALTNVQNALLGVGQATGTILNDDGFAGSVHHFNFAPVSGVKTQTVGFPFSITAKDVFGNTVSNFAGPLQLRPSSTNVAAGNLDFEQPTLTPWTPLNTSEYPGPYELVSYDVDGDGRASTAFRTIPSRGQDGLSQNIFLAGGIAYTFSISLAAAMESPACPDGAVVTLEVGNSNVVWNSPLLCTGATARQRISLVYTPPTNGTYPLRLTFLRAYSLDVAYAIYADDLQITYPVIVPALLTNGFTDGAWVGMLAALQSATNVTVQADDGEGHKGSSDPFDVQPVADLGISATAVVQGAPPLRTGMKLQFNLAVTNRGPSAVPNAMTHSQLPPNLTFLSTTNVQGSISNFAGGFDWRFGPLASGSNFSAVVVCRADLPGDFTNEFGVTTSILDLNPVNNSIALSNHIEPPLLVIGDASGNEAYASATGMVFNLTLSGPSAQTITVDYFTVNGTATNNLDFVATNGTVTFAPFTTNATIRVFVLDDILDEPNRTLTVRLTNVVNAIISDGSGAGTVIDDDPPPTISIADTALLEGDSGTTNVVFQLTMSKLAIVDVSVRCATAPNTASTNDYTHTVTTVTFPTGTTNATFSVLVRGNTVNETDESFFVTLTLPVNATIARTQAFATIINDDAVAGRLDHFAWDAIPSPRYRDWPFPVALRALDYLGNAATNGLGNTPVTARTENGYFERLSDDFEDGDSAGWTNYNASFSATVTNEPAASGAYSLRLIGSTGNTAAGLRRAFSNSQPNKITFSVRASRTNQIAGRFTANSSSLYRSAVFYFNNNGQMGLVDRQLGFRGVPYQSNRWYQVALTFNWAAQKVDCRIDGTLVLTNITFPDSITSMDAVLLANQDNTTSWWDEMRVFHDNLTNTFSIMPSNFTTFGGGVKSNLVTLSGADTGTNTFLTADDGLEHVGTSGLFDLLQANLTLVTPASVTEGSTPVAVQVRIPVPFPQPITVTLASTVPSELTVPASVTIPANQTNAGFNLTIIDDALLDGARLVSVIARATNLVSATNVVAVEDNEPAVLTLTLPATAAENTGMLIGQGQVTSSAPPTGPIAVTLTSSDTNVVQVPASVTIQSNQTTATFNVNILDDLRIDGAQSVTITASVVNWTSDSKIITVTDDETTNLHISVPAFVNEGGSAAVSVQLTGTLNTNVTIHLSSSDTNALVTAPASMVPAGLTSAVFSVTAPDNALFDGTRIVALVATAPGFISATTNVSVTDNELHHFGFSMIGSPQQGSVGFSLTLTARDISSMLMASYSTNVALSAVDGTGYPVPLTPATVGLVNGQWTGTVTVQGWEFRNVQVIATSGGVSSSSSLFDVVAPTLSVVNVTGSDLVYSPLNSRLYVNNPSGLTPINPQQSQLEASVNIGSLGTRMTISGNGQFVYLERTNGNLCRFNVASNAADLFWSSGAPQIEDMAAVPGWPSAVAVSRMDTSTSPRTRGTVVYSNGVALPNSGGGNVIEFASSLPRLYIYNSEGGCSVGMYDVNTNGLTPVTGFSWACYPGNFVGRGGFLFMASGEILHSERFILVGTHSSGTAVGGDEIEGRCYLWQHGGNQSSIVARDLHTMLPMGSTDLPAVTAAAGSLIRWGTNGLAFRINGSQIAIVRSQLVPSGPTCDLVLSRVSTSGAVLVGDSYTCTYAVSNAGPGSATNVALTATLPATASLVSFGSTNGPCTAISGGVVCNIPALSAGAKALVTVTISPTKPGPMAFKVGVLSGAPDPNLTNNRLTFDVPAMYVAGYDSVVELALPANDLVYDPARGTICASVPNGNELLGNSVVTFDPQSGYYPSLIPTAVEPGKLAVADNGQYLYTSINTEAVIQRINLNTRVADLKFPTGYNGVHDMEVMPGNAGVVAATVHTTVVVYENGVPRPNVVGPTEYNFPYSLEFGGSSNRLYASFPWGFRRINVGTNGASLMEDVRDTLIVGYTYDMDFGSGLIYAINGRVFNPETKTMVTTLPYAGLVIAGPLSGYAFFLTTSGSVATLHVIDMPTRAEIRAITISGISGSAASFIRWGNDGFAFRTTGGQVFLVRSTIADDQDRDGLADSWEQLYFGSISAPNGGPADDPDQDGMPNSAEFRAGTHPLDANSKFALTDIRVDTQPGVVLRWPSATNRIYTILRSSSLQSAFLVAASNVVATPPENTFRDAGALGPGPFFYRLRVQ